MNDAFETDWKALGLDFQSPFDILRRPRAKPQPCTAPKKRGPKGKRGAKAQTTAKLTAVTSHRFNIHIASAEECARTAQIRGRL